MWETTSRKRWSISEFVGSEFVGSESIGSELVGWLGEPGSARLLVMRASGNPRLRLRARISLSLWSGMGTRGFPIWRATTQILQ
jgi:hypothetical protein